MDLHSLGKMAWGASCISGSVILCAVSSCFPKQRERRVTWQLGQRTWHIWCPFPFPLAAFFPFPVTFRLSSSSSALSFVTVSLSCWLGQLLTLRASIFQLLGLAVEAHCGCGACWSRCWQAWWLLMGGDGVVMAWMVGGCCWGVVYRVVVMWKVVG